MKKNVFYLYMKNTSGKKISYIIISWLGNKEEKLEDLIIFRAVTNRLAPGGH